MTDSNQTQPPQPPPDVSYALRQAAEIAAQRRLVMEQLDFQRISLQLVDTQRIAAEMSQLVSAQATKLHSSIMEALRPVEAAT